MRQLAATQLMPAGDVQFGPPKTGKARTIDLGAETVALLRAHRTHQLELKMKNRAHYRDLGLVFTKEQADLAGRHAELGGPMQFHKIGVGEFARIRKAAGVKRITFSRPAAYLGDAAAAGGGVGQGRQRAAWASQNCHDAGHA